MDDLKAQAEELGIKIDGRWSDDRLREEIDKYLAGPSKAEPFGGKGDHDGDGRPGGSVPSQGRTFAYRINRDYWDDKAERHRKGGIVEMTAEEAQDGLESGSITRVKV